jgi:hypothetical protein
VPVSWPGAELAWLAPVMVVNLPKLGRPWGKRAPWANECDDSTKSEIISLD